ncbi:MATE family efflux transporter [Burkholderia glumae]|uniref:MATE family efflux transporter n=1 Tax=Burkholderia glumae TaxID=337 RepID=UPI003B9A660E
MQTNRNIDRRDYYGYAGTVLATSLLSIGFGAIDIAMLAPFGAGAVAGVGLSNMILAAMLALSYGFLDQLATEVAAKHASGSLHDDAAILALSALAFCLVWCALLYALSTAVPSVLAWLHQSPAVIDVAQNYLSIRAPFVILSVCQLAIASSLRICGLKGVALVSLALGFAVNALLNWVFLYGDAFRDILKPETAVAWSTVLAQVAMIALSLYPCAKYIRTDLRFEHGNGANPFAKVKERFVDYTSATLSVGVKHLNDYVGSLLLMILIGQFGAEVQASAQISATIMTVFYRLPQSLCDATLVAYSRLKSLSGSVAAGFQRSLFQLAFWPTICAGLALWATMPWLSAVVSSDAAGIAPRACTLARIDLLFLPFYAVQHICAQFLIVDKKRRHLARWSMGVTYLLFVPAALIASHVLASPEMLYVLRGSSLLLIACGFAYPIVQGLRLSGEKGTEMLL